MQTNTLLRILIYFARQDFHNLKKKKEDILEGYCKEKGNFEFQ